MRLRPVVPADAAALPAVFLACWRGSYAGYLPQDVLDAMTDERAAALWDRALATGKQGLLAEEEGRVLGFTLFAGGVITSLYVHPAAQRRGVGRALLAAAEQALAAQGETRLHLWAFAANTPGLAFYRAQGWAEDGQTRVEPEFGPLEVRLSKAVGPAAEAVAASGPAGPLSPGSPAPAPAFATVLGVTRDGVRWVTAQGPARADGTPATRDTAFDLASVTKVVATTTALQRLVADGLLSLDTPAGQIIPGAGAARDATVRDLLLHRAGLWEWQPLYLAGPDPWAAIAGLPLRYPPGGYHYSDLGFMLLGRIIEQVAAEPLDQAVADLVTVPLGMPHTRYAPPGRPIAGPVAASSVGHPREKTQVEEQDRYPVLFADPGFRWREGEIAGEANDTNCWASFGGVAGHAGLFSTVDDLLAWAEHLAGPDLPPAWAQFFTPGPDPGQGLGWRLGPLPARPHDPPFAYHPGYTGCAVALWPGQGRAVVMLANRFLAPEPPETLDLLAAALGRIGGRP
jgi:CubicO group peptidase (beta-lactamase class C family)